MAVVCFWSWYLTERLENWVINSSSQKRTQKALPELQPRRQDDLDVFWLIHAGICVRSIQVQFTRLKIERKLFFPFLFRIHSRQNTTTVCQLLSRCLNSLSFLCSFEWRWMKVHCEEQYPCHPCTLSNDINVTDINESQVWKCVSYRKTNSRQLLRKTSVLLSLLASRSNMVWFNLNTCHWPFFSGRTQLFSEKLQQSTVCFLHSATTQKERN